MKRGWLLALIAANLVALIALVFIVPQFMVSPGPLEPGHSQLATDCFACHAPLHGASVDRCISCHALTEIGLRTTKGAVVTDRKVKVAFHQQLIEQKCMACHTDHAGPKLTHRTRKAFSHVLLKPAIKDRCESCHAAPQDKVHSGRTLSCAQCHPSESWKPASFDHALLPKAELENCQNCHKPPTDKLHSQIKGNCGQCHTPNRWTPSTFNHAKFFVLDGDHNTSCVTCHTGDRYSRYTCYGCHEHTPDNIRRKHAKEGIQDFENCVKCHRSADEKPEGGERRGARERD